MAHSSSETGVAHRPDLVRRTVRAAMLIEKYVLSCGCGAAQLTKELDALV
jgi:hypothetical protein